MEVQGESREGLDEENIADNFTGSGRRGGVVKKNVNELKILACTLSNNPIEMQSIRQSL